MGRFGTVVPQYGLLGVVEFFELLVKIDVGVREMMVGSLPRSFGKPSGVQLTSYVLLHCTEGNVVQIRWGIWPTRLNRIGSPLNSMLRLLLHLLADHERTVAIRHYDTFPMVILMLLLMC